MSSIWISFMFISFQFILVLPSWSLSEGGGQTQDGLSLLSGGGNRLWDDFKRLRVQLHTRLRGHTHDEVWVLHSPNDTFSTISTHENHFVSLVQALGGWRPRSGQSEEPNLSPADSRAEVSQLWLCSSGLLPRLGPWGGPALALLR